MIGDMNMRASRVAVTGRGFRREQPLGKLVHQGGTLAEESRL